ncbi:MAG: V-type ATP synthase subunit E [Parachlamydiales bacterium]|nr:V-type ATP synthase subunit E [Parachlamydiales bacterium]
MKELEKGKDKIQKICDILRQDTLEPAKNEAKKIIEAAEKQAEKIIHEASQEAQRLSKDSHVALEKDRQAFSLALGLAAKQAIGSLRQDIEQKLFDGQMHQLVVDGSTNPQLIADLITAIVKAIEKEGLSADLNALIPKTVKPEAVMAVLSTEIVKKLRNQTVEVGTFQGGVQLKLEDKKMTIDLSNKAIEELLANHLRKEFRQYAFGSNS